MLKLHNIESAFKSNLMIGGLVGLLCVMPVLTDLSAQTADSSGSSYDPATQSSTVRNLGVLKGTASSQAMPGSQAAPSNQQGGHTDWTASARSLALDDTGPLQPVQVGNVSYITGGIGDEERSQLQDVQKNYNFRAMSASKDGAFSGDTHILIRDAKGNELLNVTAGPLFYAELPEGHYTVEATHLGEIKQQNIHITGHKPTLAHFAW